MRRSKRYAAVLLVPVMLSAAACSGAAAASSSTSTSAVATTSTSTSPSTRAGDVPVTVQQWSVNAQTTIPAGSTTFSVKNTGTKVHEFVVYRTDTLAADIPITSYEGEQNRINEDTNGTNVGETGDLNPGATGTLTVSLTPGHYVFFCNLPKHYGLGMRLDVTVQ